MGKKVRCENCGEYLGTLPSQHGDFQAPSLGGIAYRGGIVGRIKYFCNKSCKKEWKSKKDNNSSSKWKSKNDNNSSSSDVSSESNPEMERLEWEKEQAEKREEEEKKARRKAKAKELKEENKPYSAFLVQNGEGLGIASGIVAMFLLVPILQDDNYSLRVFGIIVIAIFVLVWGFLGFKYLKEYFRK